MEGSVQKGRLKRCFRYWESIIGASRFVLDIISEGYKLPFVRFSEGI